MDPVKHHPAPYPANSSTDEPWMCLLPASRAEVGWWRVDAVSTDQAASTVSANMVIVALQLPHKARI